MIHHGFPVWRVIALAIVLGIGAAVAFSVSGLNDFSLGQRRISELNFTVGGNTLTGTLVWPEDHVSAPVVVLVHGDGPATRFLDDGMLPFVNALVDAGFGVFAWDKPGTGSSDGDWLAQSMNDRVTEAVAGYNTVLALADASAVGFVGFSQAGWVIPEASGLVDPAFAVIVGAAVNWRDQAAYFTQQRLIGEGVPAAEAIRVANAQQTAEDQALRREHPDPTAFPGMTKSRLGFVHRNYLSDSTKALSRMRNPVLAVWGAQDRNTDPGRNFARFQQALPAMAMTRLEVIPNATHSLLDAGLFDYQTPAAWGWFARSAYLFLGRKAYAEGAIDLITGWVLEAIEK